MIEINNNLVNPELIKFVNNITFAKIPEQLNKNNIADLLKNELDTNVDFNNFLIKNKDLVNCIIYKYNNVLYLLNNHFEKIDEFYTSEIDEIKNFGYSNLYFDNSLLIFGFNKSNEIMVYWYKKNKDSNFELNNKILLNNLIGGFYSKIINDSLFIIQRETDCLIFYKFMILNDDLEPEKTSKFNIQSGEVLISISDKNLFIFNNYLYVVNIESDELIEKFNLSPIFLESFEVSNNYLTFVSIENKVILFDNEVNIRQMFEEKNIVNIIIEESYLIMVNKKDSIINIYALDENGLYQKFGILDKIGEFTNVLFSNRNILIEVEGEIVGITLPKRLFDKNNFLGYGYYSNDMETNGSPIYLNNGKISTHKIDSSLLVGFSKNLSDLFFEKEKFNIEYFIQKEEPNDLLKDFIIITENLEKLEELLNNNSPNFLFIDYPNVEFFFKSTQGSSMEISKNKIITWEEDGIIKVTLSNNSSIIEILTDSDIKILGYQKITEKNVTNNSSIKIKSKECDVLVSDKILKNYQTFFPFMNGSEINGMVTKKIDDLEIEFNILPIKINFDDFSNFKSIEKNDLNQEFYRRYIIENNNKSVKITDLLSEEEIVEYKLNNIDGIKKIIYINPILIILSKPSNDIDTHIHLVNTQNNKIIPYVISNNKHENLTELFTYHNQNLIFVTENNIQNIVYIITFDNFNEVSNINKIVMEDKVNSINLFNNYLLIETEFCELILYDIGVYQNLVSLVDKNLLGFDLYHNNLILLTKEDSLKIYIYEIKPNFELIYEDCINDITEETNIKMGPGKIILTSQDKISVYNFDKFNGMVKLKDLEENFIHYYKNILISEYENQFKIYRFSPEVKYIDNHVNCNVKLDNIKIINNKNVENDLSIFLQINEKSKLLLNNMNITNNLCQEKCISRLDINIKPCEEIILESKDKNSSFCGIIVGKFLEKLPCFLAGTIVNTPNGKIPIEQLKNDDIIFDENNECVKILLKKSWTTNNFNNNTIPYIIPKNSLKPGYPNKDTYLSPFHKIKLPNGDFKVTSEINLPFVKQIRNNGNTLNFNNFEINKITYHNFILEKNSNFIANGMIVESLDKNNKLVSY